MWRRAAARHRLRHILVEPSDHDPRRNVGDAAMLEVTLTRLGDRWPERSIRVLSDVPDQFPHCRVNVTPIDTRGRQLWLDGRARQPITPLLARSRTMKGAFGWLRAPVARALRRRREWRGYHRSEVREFVETVSTADLVIVAGMGGITDAFPEFAFGVLETLGLAIRQGVATAMVGQGIGPLHDARLHAQARAVLPRVDLIALREGRAGEPLLRGLGVPADRVWTTGDDSIEMAYSQRGDVLGSALGVNLRVAPYAKVGPELIDQVRRGVQEAARRHQATLVGLPISRVPGREDARTISRLLAGYDKAADDSAAIENPHQVIERIRRCRVVVTGSYHGGVFALASGVPAVGLAGSPYYVDKFLGLATSSGVGARWFFCLSPTYQERYRQRLTGSGTEHTTFGRNCSRRRHSRWSGATRCIGGSMSWWNDGELS